MSFTVNSVRYYLHLNLILTLQISVDGDCLILYPVQITERLRDPRGLRRGGFSNVAPRNQGRRGFPRPVSLLYLSFEMKQIAVIDYWILCVFEGGEE